LKEKKPGIVQYQLRHSAFASSTSQVIRCRPQIDGATPQPVQKMTFDGLLHLEAKQKRLAREVFTCHEAGAFGFFLHRKDFYSKKKAEPFKGERAANLERALT
jgi:hypothetical protein